MIDLGELARRLPRAVRKGHGVVVVIIAAYAVTSLHVFRAPMLVNGSLRLRYKRASNARSLRLLRI